MIITNLAEVKSFGLENPSSEFTIWEGNKKYKIFVGDKTADEERYYVKYNDEDLLLLIKDRNYNLGVSNQDEMTNFDLIFEK